MTDAQTHVALGLFGISYSSNYKHWHPLMGSLSIDFQESIDNYTSMLIDPIVKKHPGAVIDNYLSTQSSDRLDAVLTTYKPQGFTVVHDVPTHRFLARNLHLLNVCRLINQAQVHRGIIYDIVILTRFDLHFDRAPLDLNIDMTKLNVSSRAERDPLIDDNIYIISGKLLSAYIAVQETCMHISHHHIRKRLEASSLGELNFMVPGNCLTSKNPVFHIKRNGRGDAKRDPNTVAL